MKRRSISRPASFNTGDMSDAILKGVDDLLNLIFALAHETALLRSTFVWVSLILIWLALAFTAQPAEAYRVLINNWFNVLAAGNPQNTLISGFKLLASIFLNLEVIRHLLAMYAPFWLMQRVAGIYLADIFEKDEYVAHTFIQQAAFAKSYNTIHIRQGKVAEEDLDSPMVQIGGPGYVVVEFDSAVVFERPDGSPHVIGPTSRNISKNVRGAGSRKTASQNYIPTINHAARELLEENANKNREVYNETYGSTLIEGFERIRQGIDLRDVLYKQEVATRSRDGIPVTARDIQYSYSIFRGQKPVKSPKTPFPFDENAVLNLVYGMINLVKLNEPPARSHDWLEPLPGKISGQINLEISSFVSKRGLSDFLVAVGKPEDENTLERKKENDQHLQTISGSPENWELSEALFNGIEPAPEKNPAAESVRLTPVADFAPRAMLTKMFYDNFQAKAPQRGTQLNWIGVGTWETPNKIIIKNHQEAWQISRENMVRSNPLELQKISEEAMLREQIQLIENSVIRKYHNEKYKPQTDEQVTINMLKEYKHVLETARELYRPNIPNEILMAIQEIENWIYPPSYSVGNED